MPIDAVAAFIAGLIGVSFLWAMQRIEVAEDHEARWQVEAELERNAQLTVMEFELELQRAQVKEKLAYGQDMGNPGGRGYHGTRD